MKKFITILLSCSLALAASAIAQQGDESPAPKKKQQERAHDQREARPAAKAQIERKAPTGNAMKKVKEPVAATNNTKAQIHAKEPAAVNANANANTNVQATHHNKKERNLSDAPVTTNQPATPAPAKADTQVQAQKELQANKPNAGAHRIAAEKKKPDINAIKAQHASFHAQPKPQQVPAVTFNQSHKIEGSEHWEGEKYARFRSYHPERHDQNFYHSHYSRIELIGGGYYYFNGGYWYPAWGYQPTEQYYAYDGPIYAGSRAEPPDRVIADVQATLQDMGYYEGEVDGLLGPLTRQALTGYQADSGLYTTAAIDEPTLASLGMD